ncbi:diguanylate cyclase domain-containing protein [Agarilytica rhodophyticola]|uniref:diguanylate cyclase domain-containing protein n=1 Tax=Agarilytica rhodophyticola TaxID=1737490 RepID=UPI003CCC08E4
MDQKFQESINKFSHLEDRSHFGIFVIDVKRLKRINDQHGHDDGDRMLINVCIRRNRRISLIIRVLRVRSYRTQSN